jgi:hypothetical protein
MTITRRIAFVLLLAFGFAHEIAAQPAQTVHLVVDYGDGAMKIINDIPWTQGSTVLDVMNAAKARPHGITFEFRGDGASALLTKIDDLTSQGGGAAKKNWQFWVNAAYGNRSFGVYEVQPQDTVLWRFTERAP